MILQLAHLWQPPCRDRRGGTEQVHLLWISCNNDLTAHLRQPPCRDSLPVETEEEKQSRYIYCEYSTKMRIWLRTCDSLPAETERRNGTIAGLQPGHSSLKAVIGVIHQKLTKLHPKDGASQVRQVAFKVQHVDSMPAKPVGVNSLSRFLSPLV